MYFSYLTLIVFAKAVISNLFLRIKKFLILEKISEKNFSILSWIFSATITFLAYQLTQTAFEETKSVSKHHLRSGAFNDIPTQKSQININLASPDELIQLEGIGPVLAERIIEYRQTRGKFKSPESLLLVKGMGKKKLTKIEKEINF